MSCEINSAAVGAGSTSGNWKFIHLRRWIWMLLSEEILQRCIDCADGAFPLVGMVVNLWSRGRQPAALGTRSWLRWEPMSPDTHWREWLKCHQEVSEPMWVQQYQQSLLQKSLIAPRYHALSECLRQWKLEKMESEEPHNSRVKM